MLKPGDNVVIERKTGYRTHGKMVSENESGILVEGTVGDFIGDMIFVRWENVDIVRFVPAK
jgi:hypothetical protein